jgi:hypothetical protein
MLVCSHSNNMSHFLDDFNPPPPGPYSQNSEGQIRKIFVFLGQNIFRFLRLKLLFKEKIIRG